MNRAFALVLLTATLLWPDPICVAGRPLAQDNPGAAGSPVDSHGVGGIDTSALMIISGQPLSSSPTAFPAQKSAAEPRPECRITNVFYDTDVREILQAIATQCNVNVLADESVTGVLTAELTDLPLEEAMQRVLSPFGLAFRWMNGYYLVGSPRPDNPSFLLLTETQLYRPNFIKASDIPALMSSYYEPFLRVNRETNTVALVGSSELIARMKADLARIDRAPRQVMIEALVTETSSDINRQLGFSLSSSGKQGIDRSYGLEVLPPGQEKSDTSVALFLERVGIPQGGWLAQYRLRLHALVDEGKAHIRANPRIATIEGNKARIFIGREEYFSILNGSVSFAYAQLEVIKTGITLTITPYVSEDNLITLEVEPEVSDVVGSSSTGLPVNNKRSVTTKVRVADGETVVIGGLTVNNRIEITRKIPLLGSIPIIGVLFRHNETRIEENEITVLITPHLSVPTSAPGG